MTNLTANDFISQSAGPSSLAAAELAAETASQPATASGQTEDPAEQALVLQQGPANPTGSTDGPGPSASQVERDDGRAHIFKVVVGEGPDAENLIVEAPSSSLASKFVRGDVKSRVATANDVASLLDPAKGIPNAGEFEGKGKLFVGSVNGRERLVRGASAAQVNVFLSPKMTVEKIDADELADRMLNGEKVQKVPAKKSADDGETVA